MQAFLAHVDRAELDAAASALLKGGQTVAEVADAITDALVAVLPLKAAAASVESATADPALRAAEVIGSDLLQLAERPLIRLVVGFAVRAAAAKLK